MEESGYYELMPLKYLKAKASPNIIFDFGSVLSLNCPSVFADDVHAVSIHVRDIDFPWELIGSNMGQNDWRDLRQPLLDSLNPSQRLSSLESQ